MWPALPSAGYIQIRVTNILNSSVMKKIITISHRKVKTILFSMQIFSLYFTRKPALHSAGFLAFFKNQKLLPYENVLFSPQR